MAIGDVVSKVVLEFKGDTKDLTSEIKKLQGTEKQWAEQQLAQANARNKQLEAWNDRLGKLAVGVAAVGLAAKLAFDSYEISARKATLQTQAAGVSIDAMRRSSGFLVSEMKALEQAAALQRSSFKLTQGQMNMVMAAQRQLVREGNDHEAVIKKVTDAIVKLETGALSEFGIRIRAGATDAEKFTAIMDALAGKAKLVDGAATTQAESIKQLGVRFEDTFDRIRTSMGNVVVAMQPLLTGVAKLAELAGGLLSRVANGWDVIVTAGRYAAGGDESLRRDLFLRLGGNPDDLTEKIGNRFGEYAQQGGSQADFITSMLREDTAGYSGRSSSVAYETVPDATPASKALSASRKAGQESARRLAEERREMLRRLADEQTKALTDDLLKRLESEGSDLVIGGDLGAVAGSQDTTRALLDRFYTPGGEQSKRDAAAYAEYRDRNANDKLTAMFGNVDEYSTLATAFGSLQGAFTSSFDAFISGSKSAKEAFSDFLSGTLKSLSVSEAVQSLKELAWGFGELAFGSAPKAALHFKSAAMHAATAAAAGAGAKLLGGGGGGGGGGASSAPGGGVSTGAGGGAAPPQGSHVVYVIGDQFTDHTPRQRQQSFKRMASQAVGTGGVLYK